MVSSSFLFSNFTPKYSNLHASIYIILFHTCKFDI
jgi:hypothetical protein